VIWPPSPPLNLAPQAEAPFIGTTGVEGRESITVEEFRDNAAEWDDYVKRAAHGTFCHLSGWREILSDTLGHECRYFVARDEAGKCCGILPLARVRSRLFGDYLLSMPFLNYGGPLGTPQAELVLARRAQRMAREFNADLLELRTRHGTQNELQPANRKVTVVLPLPSSAEVLMTQFPAKLRSQIRRPLKEGMEARFGVDQKDAFYSVFARNMRDLGTPVLPRQLFEDLARVFAREVEFCAVFFRGEPVAAGCGFTWGQEFELTWASSLREYSRHAPNMLLYWELMRHTIKGGVRAFNFGRCTPGSGTHRFKLQWGGETIPLPWRQWSSTATTTLPTPDRPLFRMATRVWSRMPLAMANAIGPLVARSLP
jgi:serine/alanine adding enzyme